MNGAMTVEHLWRENLAYCGTGGVSTGYSAAGFISAFCDTATGRVEPSRLADGSPAAMHLLAGLPSEWVAARAEDNAVTVIKATVIAGFVRAGVFYTRAQAAKAALH